MAELTASPSIDDARTQALLVLIDRLSTLDLTPLLIYRIDSVVESALPFLAWQFDVLSPLWQLTAPSAAGIDVLTDIDSLTDIDLLSGPDVTVPSDTRAREVLKLAIALHRQRGTPSSIKQALASLGWSNVTLVEGQASWGGTEYPTAEGWAVYRVMINLAMGEAVPAGSAVIAIAAAQFFQPARAWLDSLWFVIAPLSDAGPSPVDAFTLSGFAEFQIDTAPVAEDGVLVVSINTEPLLDVYGPIAPIYDARYVHSGITYGQNEPAVADPAMILNGTAVLHGG